MQFKTERLILREYTVEDFNAMYEIVSDTETMQHYPEPFDMEKASGLFAWNLQNYKEYGFGLWAVCLKSGEFIGDCGITIQNIDGEQLPEIGYHINKNIGGKGLAVKLPVQYGIGHLRIPTTIKYIHILNILMLVLIRSLLQTG